jgi:hypothetical protein
MGPRSRICSTGWLTGYILNWRVEGAGAREVTVVINSNLPSSAGPDDGVPAPEPGYYSLIPELDQVSAIPLPSKSRLSAGTGPDADSSGSLLDDDQPDPLAHHPAAHGGKPIRLDTHVSIVQHSDHLEELEPDSPWRKRRRARPRPGVLSVC